MLLISFKYYIRKLVKFYFTLRHQIKNPLKPIMMKSETQQQIEKINFLLIVEKLQSDIKKQIKSLNCGGCGIFAYLFYMAIKDKFPEVEISIYDRWMDINEIKDIASIIAKNNNTIPEYGLNHELVDHLACSHVMVKLGDQHIDGYGIINHEKWEDFNSNRGYYTVEELKTALIFGSWNDNYCRGQNPKLQKLIEKHLDCKIII